MRFRVGLGAHDDPQAVERSLFREDELEVGKTTRLAGTTGLWPVATGSTPAPHAGVDGDFLQGGRARRGHGAGVPMSAVGKNNRADTLAYR